MKRIINFILLFSALAVFNVHNAYAQETDAEDDPLANRIMAQVILENGYPWRGTKSGEVDLQGYAGILYNGFCSYLWVLPDPITPDIYTSFNVSYYTPFGLGIGFNDYFETDNHGYFNYKARETCHTIEAFVELDALVASFGWYTVIGGWDGYAELPGYKRPYSTYCELNVPFKLWNLDWESQIGFMPFNANKTEFYMTDCSKHGFAVTTVSLIANKPFKCGKLPLTAFAGVIELPSTRHTYIAAGLKYDFQKLLKKH